MGIVNNVLAGASGNQGYFLSRSLRIRSSASAFLSRTPSVAGNRKTWTWSGWVKRGNLTADIQILFGQNSGAFVGTTFGFQSAGNLYYTINSVGSWSTSPLLRDPSAWYHIVIALDTTQATASNRLKIYVNNQSITISSYNYSQNTDYGVNQSGVAHYMGYDPTQSYFDGYLAEVNFIDGQALTPSSFGMNDPATGVWEPKKYTGTYGTNGFYLPFTDNSNNTATTIGKDFSGNGNNWTPNNISVTAGATYDSMTDVPTLTSATAANYCVLNPLNINPSYITGANLNLTNSGVAPRATGTFGITSGKWYWEATTNQASYFMSSGLWKVGGTTTELLGYADALSWGWYANTGQKWNNNNNTAWGSAFTSTNDVLGVAFDADSGDLYFYKNGTLQGGGAAFTGLTSGPYFPAISSNGSTGSANINFGQRPFAYTPPSGFVALNTFNLPTPTIGATPSSQANRYMDVSLWTGNGANPSTPVSNLNFAPDFVWIKDRSSSAFHNISDIVRGTSKILQSNTTSAEQAAPNGGVSAFNSNGFTVQGSSTVADVNTNGNAFVAWSWRANGAGVTNTAGSITSTVSANTTAGFSIVAYTGNGTNGATVGHGLGVKPKLIIEKGRTSAYNWSVQGCGELWTPATSTLFLNTANTLNASGAIAAPTSTVFTPSAVAYANENGVTNIAYVFAEVAGYSKFGSYTGNGSADGPFVFCGFRPRFILIKDYFNPAGGNNWVIFDTARDTYNVCGAILRPNLADAELVSPPRIDILSNGFKIRVGGALPNDANGANYIYAAFAESPFKYSLAR